MPSVSRSTPGENVRIDSLDGLRAIAVLLVISRHWIGYSFYLEFGWIGVSAFFVLSGFLITAILLREKEQRLSVYLGKFYARRSLRIFPIYFLFLIATSALCAWYQSSFNTGIKIDEFDHVAVALKSNRVLLFTYTFNFKAALDCLFSIYQVWGTKFFNHLWSLAIEEQFYFIFPLIVFFFNRRTLKGILLSVIVISPIIRAIGGEWLKSHGCNLSLIGHIIYESTPFQLDALALGCLIAVVGWKSIRASNKKVAGVIALILVMNLLSVYFLRSYGAQVEWDSLGFDLATDQIKYRTGIAILDLKYAYSFTMLNLIFGGVLLLCLRNTVVSKVLSYRPLVHTGKVSYGIYLYHYPAILMFEIALRVAGISMWEASILEETFLLVIFLLALLLVSTMSFKLIEKPLLRMRPD